MSEARWRHFVGALLTKVLPIAVQVCLLWLTAHRGSLTDVGKLAFASALSFACGTLGDLGFSTSLSAPVSYFGTDEPPLRGTRAVRLAGGAAASLLFLILWEFALGTRDGRLLLLAPLPLFLALSYGYSGVLNAHGRLWREGKVAVGESVAIVGLATGVAILGADPLVASLLALSVGRGLGMTARALLVRSVPLSAAVLSRHAVTSQIWFAVSTVVLALQAQAELLLLGLLGRFLQLAVYSPLLRTAYGTVLVAEAMAWALFGRAGDPGTAPTTRQKRGSRFDRIIDSQRFAGVVVGVTFAITFVLMARPIVTFILGRSVPSLTLPALLLGMGILLRFVSFGQTVTIVRAGHQKERIRPALVATVVSAAIVVMSRGQSLAGLAAARLVGEATLVLGFQPVVRRARRADATTYHRVDHAPAALLTDPRSTDAP